MTQKAEGSITFERAVREPSAVRHFVAELLRTAPVLSEQTPVIVVEPELHCAAVRVTVYSDWTPEHELPAVLARAVARVGGMTP